MNAINMAQELFIEDPAEVTPITDAEADRMSKAVLAATDINTVMAILEDGMISKYANARRFKEILDIIEQLQIKQFMDPAEARLCLKQGIICENMRDYDQAIDYYTFGIHAHAAMVDPNQIDGYWLFNNNAFCYNHERFFLTAKKMADKAISINAEQHNAWKNLGISLEHQDKHIEAAACYMASYIKCGGGRDPRPMMHLERMFKRHEKLKDELADKAEKEIGGIFTGPFKDFSLGETYYYCGHFDRAIDSYEKFYADAPSGYSGCLEYAQKIVKELKELRKMEAQFAVKEEVK